VRETKIENYKNGKKEEKFGKWKTEKKFLCKF